MLIPYKSAVPTSQVTWSSVQSFTTPTNVTVPVLGSLSTANLTTTTADLESTLSDNGNAATNLVFYWGDNDGGTNPSSWDSNFTVSNAQEGTLRKSLTGLTGGTTYYFRSFRLQLEKAMSGQAQREALPPSPVPFGIILSEIPI